MLIEQQEPLKAPKYLAQIIVCVILAVSVGFNIYTALKSYKDKLYQEGFTKGQDAIVQQIRTGMQVNFDDGVIVFIKKQ